jgi:hypothetical protein
MKKILAMVFFLLLAAGYAASFFATAVATNSSSSSVENTVVYQDTLADLQAKGLMIIEDQSFPVELENWGKVRFISGRMGDPIRKAYFYLAGNNGQVLYSFPEFSGNSRNFCTGIRAIAFSDFNHDGLTDIIIIAEFVTGIGPTGTVPFPVAGTYFQKDKKFINDPNLDKQINDAGKNKKIEMVVEFIEGKTP